MLQAHTKFSWGILGHSQRGASHVRQNLPNQDALARWPGGDEEAAIAILAVADGHGSEQCFRSDLGSRFAVDVAVDVCREFAAKTSGAPLAEITEIKRAAEWGIPADIVRTWRKKVAQYHQQNPFTDDELNRLAEQAGPEARDLALCPGTFFLAYGATLLVTVLTNEYLLGLQLGDGDILLVESNRNVTRLVQKDESLIANETTSLCQDEADKLFRCQFKPLGDCPPALVLLSTDGYSNSFASTEAFFKAGADYLDLIWTDGAAGVAQQMPAWLEYTSSHGSGDDITIGLIYRQRPPVSEVAQQAEPGAIVTTIEAESGGVTGDGQEANHSLDHTASAAAEEAMTAALTNSHSDSD